MIWQSVIDITVNEIRIFHEKDLEDIKGDIAYDKTRELRPQQSRTSIISDNTCRA